MAGQRGVVHVTSPVAAVAEQLPSWATLVRAPNPGPMTLDGTNTWVLRAGEGAPAVVVDPGPVDEPHLRVVAGHGPIAAVLVTHGHPDHVDGLERFRELTGAELRPPVSQQVAGLTITAVAAPGHTSDSTCFLVAAGGERAMLTGDTILGRGTTVVAWPDGDLGDYLASLRRLSAYTGLPVLPGHGPALTDCGAAARYYLAHRQARLAQVRAALAAGATTAAEVVAQVYADVDRALWPAAEWSVRATLAYLERPARESSAGSGRLDEP
jgi:glyoxylase-like metal-dependent hydrolase (beta-lactamase superfamily II)